MPCGCQNKGTAGRPMFEVVAQSGKVVFSSPSRPTADAVGRRYPNSSVRPAGGTAAKNPVSVDKTPG